MKLKLTFGVFLWMFFHCLTTYGQGVVSSTLWSVLDTAGTSLSSAAIRNVRTGRTVVSDSAGRFSLVMQRGDVLEVTMIGYQTKRVSAFSGGAIYLTPSNEIGR